MARIIDMRRNVKGDQGQAGYGLNLDHRITVLEIALCSTERHSMFLASGNTVFSE